MATTSKTRVAPAAADDTEFRALQRKELRWKISVERADVAQKIFISIIGAAVAGIFYVYQANQTESRYKSDLQAQRERADTDLRANMFKTLFDAYFKNKFEALQKAAAAGTNAPTNADTLLSNLGNEVMLSDLLARNFETMDVRPLFEDLDRRLMVLAEHGGEQFLGSQATAFRQREELRRVAFGATSRQIETLQASAKADVQRIVVTQCQDASLKEVVFTPNELPGLPGSARGLVRRVGDGSVDIELIIPNRPASERLAWQGLAGAEFSAPLDRKVPISVTFFDMPALENVRLSDGSRLSITLMSSISTRSCRRFMRMMAETVQNDCAALLEQSGDTGRSCSKADLSLTVIPKGFIGMRDRPYLDELSRSSNPFGGGF
jgi:hypothetical protein